MTRTGVHPDTSEPPGWGHGVETEWCKEELGVWGHLGLHDILKSNRVHGPSVNLTSETISKTPSLPPPSAVERVSESRIEICVLFGSPLITY